MTTKIPLAVYWAEGMMLCPQHFQQFCERIEQIGTLQFNLSRPFFWGVIEFEYDKEALVSGTLIIENLLAIMPDGLYFSYERKQSEQSLSLQFQEQIGNQTKVQLSFGVNEVTSEHPDSRYLITNVAPVADMFNPDIKLAYQALQVNGQLFVADQIKPGYVSLPLVEMQLTDGVWRETNFIPPTVRVKTDNKAGQRVNALLEQISIKLATLESKLTSPESAELVDTYRLKYIISNIYGDLAILAAHAKNDAAHPYDIYLVLCSIWGKLSGFSELKGFDEYLHQDINLSYQRLGDKILATINHLIPLCSTITINMNEQYEFILLQRYLTVGKQIVFGINKSNFDTKDACAKWLQNLTIAARGDLARIQQTRTQGFSRRLVIGHYSDQILATENAYLIEVGFDTQDKLTGHEDIIIYDTMATQGRAAVRTIYLYRSDEV